MKKIITLIFSFFVIGATIFLAYFFIPRTTVKPKEVLIKLSSKVEKVYIDKDSKFNPLDNLDYDEENKDKILCTPSELNDGENKITCLLSDKKCEYTVIVSSTYKKSAVFFTDELFKGTWTNNLKDSYDFEVVDNHGQSEYSLTSKDKNLINLVKSASNKNYDFVILQGGIQEVLNKSDIGEIKIDNKDGNTVVGALNLYLDEAINNFKGKRIGFIINYDTSSYKNGKTTYKREDIQKYYDAMKQILDARKIPYLDLFSDEYTDSLSTYLPDKLHLNEDGYKLIVPDVYNFMKVLPKYE